MSIFYNIKNFAMRYKKEYLTHKDIAQVYDDISKSHSSALSSGFLENLEKALPLLELKKDMKILDIGCGDGNITAIIPDDCFYLGIDMSRKMIDKANKDHKNSGKNLFFEKVEANAFLNYAKAGTYDLIIFSFSWKYFDHDFLSKAFALLKKNGKVMVINDLKENQQTLLASFEQFKKEHQQALLKINPFTSLPESIQDFESAMIHLGARQTIFFPTEKNYPFLNEYIFFSGIVPELALEFGHFNDLYQKKFLEFLKEKQFRLPPQKFFICIAKI